MSHLERKHVVWKAVLQLHAQGGAVQAQEKADLCTQISHHPEDIGPQTVSHGAIPAQEEADLHNQIFDPSEDIGQQKVSYGAVQAQ